MKQFLVEIYSSNILRFPQIPESIYVYTLVAFTNFFFQFNFTYFIQKIRH